MSNTTPHPDDLVFTVTWQAKPAEVGALTDIVRRFRPLAEGEPGLKLLRTQQSASDPTQFLFYEVFVSEQAFAAHQETEHFKNLILQEAVPRLEKRERIRYRPL